MQRRLWALRLSVVAAIAVSVGVSSAEVQARSLRRGGVATLAAERGVDLATVRAAAVAAATPLLDDAVRSGTLNARQGAAIRRSVEDALTGR